MAEMTELRLLNVPIEKDYKHTLYFTSASNQYEYFNSKVKKKYDDFSYQRKDGVVRIPDHADNLLAAGCNYVMYKNPSYPGKWFYAFIESIDYESPGKTNVKIKTDCIQTWMFNIDIKPSFVEREHTKNDEIGENTITEGLETGEYTVNQRSKLSYGGNEYVVVVGVTKSPDGLINAGTQIHGIYSGVMYYALENNINGQSINDFVSKYDADAAAEAITCMFLAPKALAAAPGGAVSYGEHIPSSAMPHKTYINKAVSGWVGNAEVVQEFSNGKVDGYTPRNNKLLCYPYRYLLVSNNAGGAAMYKFERFFSENDTGAKTLYEPSFTVEGCLTPGCSVRLIPNYYNGAQRNTEEGLNMGKFPVLNWTSDVYTNWLTQNSVNIAIDVASSAGQIVMGAMMATGSGGLLAGIGAGTIVSGATQIANTMAQVRQQSLVPPQAKGNQNASDVIAAAYDNTFHFYTMSVRSEYAKQIDEFFDMYGYKCHRVKIPEKMHRKEYWYTKTIDANIDGVVPQEDLQTIKDCYNNGITFWRNAANIGNYAVSNPIV